MYPYCFHGFAGSPLRSVMLTNEAGSTRRPFTVPSRPLNFNQNASPRTTMSPTVRRTNSLR